jgi:hypothetical protein
MMDIGQALFRSEGLDRGTKSQTLLEVPQFLEIELVLQLGLTHEDHLEEFFRRGLKVGKHPEVLQSLDGHVLGLIDDESNIAALFIFFE